MKKFFAPIVLFAATTAISSCTLSGLTPIPKKEAATKEITSYVLFQENGDTVDYLTERKQKTITAVFADGEELIPYLSLSQYASLVSPFLLDGYYSDVQESSESGMWLVRKDEGKGEEDPLYFASVFAFKSGAVGVGGSLSGLTSLPETVNADALSYRAKMDSALLNKDDAENLATFAYSTSDFSYFTVSSEHYLPLGLLDISLSDATGLNISFDYTNLLIYDSYDRLEEKLYPNATHNEGEEKSVSALEQIKAKVAGKQMPSYLATYNRSCFIYLMDNFYGLAEELGISRMRNYYLNATYYAAMASQDASIRQRAYSLAVSSLNDGHTALSKTSNIWGERAEDNVGRTGLWADRIALRNSLLAERQKMYAANEKNIYDIFYSESGETAFFSFDSFIFAPSLEALRNEEETAFAEEAYKVDTSALVVRQFEEIKNTGTVKNVVIDLSTNGGGTVGSLFRVLALLSNDNKANVYYRNIRRNAIIGVETSIDSNFDDEYDLEDVYGDDFNIFFLTSSFTYSCGNALPYFAYLSEYGKCIGSTSGGGECFVGSHILPNFQMISHSSNNQLGSYDESSKTFVGDEKGTPLSKKVYYGDFYDVDALEENINEINN